MRIWLDDERPMPPGYDVHVKNSNYMYTLIDMGLVTSISFDHDLGSGFPTGNDIAKYIEELCAKGKLVRWIRYSIHSCNPVGRVNILNTMQNANKLWEKYNV